jgi:hypothetical protein
VSNSIKGEQFLHYLSECCHLKKNSGSWNYKSWWWGGDERNRTTATLALKYRVTPLAPSGVAVLVQSAGIPIAIMQADGGEALR